MNKITESEIPLKEMLLKKGNKGVFAISLVNAPAIEENFLALSKTQHVVKLKTTDEEKRIVTGLVLVPDKHILRIDDNEQPYNIFFSAETIRQTAQLYLDNGHNKDATIEHQFNVDGIKLFETWIVEDENNDKLNALGIDPVKGGWAVSLKVDNDEVWNDYVKTGLIKGFSIEGGFAMQETELKSVTKLNTNMNKKTMFANMISFLTGMSDDIKLERVNTMDGNNVLEFESLEVGETVFVVGEAVEGGEPELTPAPDGDYELESGDKFSVEGGVIATVETVEAAPDEEAAKVAEELSKVKETNTTLSSEKTALQVELDLAKVEIVALKEVEVKFNELKTKVAETESKLEGLEVALAEASNVVKPEVKENKVSLSDALKGKTTRQQAMIRMAYNTNK